MRKKAGLAIIISAIACILLAYLVLGSGKRYKECLISDTDAQDIMQERTEDQMLVTSVLFDSEELFFDSESSSLFYSVIEDKADAMNPIIKARSGEKALKVAALEDEEGTARLLIYDEKTYCTRDLVCTTLPVMSICCDNEIGETEQEVSIELFDNRKNADKRLVLSDGTIRERGGTTSSFPKKPYKLSLTTQSVGEHKRSNDISLLGMRKDDDWILYAAYNDQEKVRNVFSQELWSKSCATDNSYGIDTTIDYEYIELFIDGRYAGLYALGHTPDENRMGLDNAKTEGLYKKKDSGLEKFYVKNKEAETDPVKNRILTRLIYNYFFDLEDNCFDPEYLKSAIDMDNAIDFYLFVCLIQGTDNLHKNYYVILKETENGYRSVYVPWDMDMSWGNQWIDDGESNLTSCYLYDPSDSFLFTDGYLYWLLFDNDEETYQKLVHRYEELRSGAWSNESIISMLDEYEKDVFTSGAYLRDKERWPYGNYIEDGDEYSLDRFKGYVLERLSCMDNYLNRIKEQRYANPFIEQTLLYEDLSSSKILVRYEDRSVLEDQDYKELLDFIGIDTDEVTDECGFIVYDVKKDIQQNVSYYEDLDNGVDTVCGVLRTGRSDINIYDYDDEHSVFLDDLDCMYVIHDSLPISISVVSGDGFSKSMNLDKSYKTFFSMYAIEDYSLMLQALCHTGENYVLTFNKEDMPEDMSFLDKYELDLGEYKSLEEAFDTEKSVVILLDCDYRRARLINNALVSGTVCETEMGIYSYFENDGYFGMYFNGNELLTGSTEEVIENSVMTIDE